MSTLDARQLGHLRHFDNLSRQFPNDWSLMQGKGTGQDDFGGYRFQLAYMAYALALTHRHRLPAAPGLGHRVEVEPMTGNVLLGYARLNVPDGLWGLYNQPWDRAHFTEPALTAVERDVEVSQAEVTDGVLRTRLRRLPGLPGEGTVTISRVAGRGRWAVEADGQVMAKIQNNSAERGHEPPTLTVHVVGEEVILRCDEQPRVFMLRPEP